MKIRNITYTNSPCKYHSHHNWIIETTSNDYNEVLKFSKQFLAEKKRSLDEYVQAKESVNPTSETAMSIRYDGYYSLELLNDGKPTDKCGFYQWKYITHAENIY